MKKVCTLLIVAMSFWTNGTEAQTSYTSGYLGNSYFNSSTFYLGNTSHTSGYFTRNYATGGYRPVHYVQSVNTPTRTSGQVAMQTQSYATIPSGSTYYFYPRN